MKKAGTKTLPYRHIQMHKHKCFAINNAIFFVFSLGFQLKPKLEIKHCFNFHYFFTNIYILQCNTKT